VFSKLNPFAVHFKKSREDYNIDERNRQRVVNSQAMSQEEITTRINQGNDYNSAINSGPANEIMVNGLSFQQVFENKRQRIIKYREMSNFTEIENACDHISDDCMMPNDEGNVVEFVFNKELPSTSRIQLKYLWKYLMDDVLNINENGWDMFRRWLVDSELYGENILNDRKNSIIGVKLIPAWTLMPIYDGGIIKGYTQITDKQDKGQKNKTEIQFDQDQINYINYGRFGENMTDVRGYLESSIKPYNQLKNMEDSLVVYRLSRAVERRAWNVFTGKMPKDKAEAYVKNLIQKYRKKMTYDVSTGAMNTTQNVMAMTEDYWFTVNSDGQGTKVDTIPGGANLGEITDVEFFMKKLQRSLKMPKSRWSDENNLFSSGRSNEITRDEIKLALFEGRLQNRFKHFLLNMFMVQMRLKELDKKLMNESLYNVKFTESNLFKKFKEAEILETNLNNMSQVSNFIFGDEHPDGQLSPEFCYKKYFDMSDEDWQANQNQIKDLKRRGVGAGATGEAGGAEGAEGAAEVKPGEEKEFTGGPEPKNDETEKEGWERKDIITPDNDGDFSMFKAWRSADQAIKNRHKPQDLFNLNNK
jgi:hypothetical protein